MIEDLEKQRVVVHGIDQPKATIGLLYLSGRHVEDGGFAESGYSRNIRLRSDDSKILNVGIKNWPIGTGERYIVFVVTRRLSLLVLYNHLKKKFLGPKARFQNLDPTYDMLPLMEMMEAPDKSRIFLPSSYRRRMGKGIF